MKEDHSKSELIFMKLINYDTNKIWTITVEGENITTQLDNRKPKTIVAEFPDMKAQQLIVAQLKKGFVYSVPEAAAWEPCYRTYINRIYTGFMPIATNKNRSDFYVLRVIGQFEDEIIFHYDHNGQLLDSQHLGKDRLTYRAILLDDGKIVLNSSFSHSGQKKIELFDPSDGSILEVQEGELLHAFDQHDDHSDSLNDYKVSHIGYNNPSKRRILRVENIQTSTTVTEIEDLFIIHNAFCAFTADKLVVHSDYGVLSIYTIPK